HRSQVHAYRIVHALRWLRLFHIGWRGALNFDDLALRALLRFSFLALIVLVWLGLGGLDHIDARLAEHCENIFHLLGIDRFRAQHRVDVIVGDVAALLGSADELLDARIGEVEQRAVRRGFRVLRCLFLVWHLRGPAWHGSPPGAEIAPIASLRDSR